MSSLSSFQKWMHEILIISSFRLVDLAEVSERDFRFKTRQAVYLLLVVIFVW